MKHFPGRKFYITSFGIAFLALLLAFLLDTVLPDLAFASWMVSFNMCLLISFNIAANLFRWRWVKTFEQCDP